MIRVLVNGAKGRMGLEVVKAVSAQKDLILAAGIDVDDDLEKSIFESKADVVVDFTIPDTVMSNAISIINSGARPVIGTTGLKPEEINHLRSMVLEKKIGGVVAPNFAIGAVLLMHYATHAAQYMKNVEIIELHHDKKLDAPSGTARLTAEKIAETKTFKTLPKGNDFRGGIVESIHIHSIRLPGLVAHQEVIFGEKGQTLSLRHDSISRESFMPGVLLSIRKVINLNRLVVGLENLLNL